jgi:hypothetical protein
MSKGYRLVTSASRIPVPGRKLVEEHFGNVNTKTNQFSLAHIVAPPGWGEPFQNPKFGELTIMTRGTGRARRSSSKPVSRSGSSRA